MLKHELLDEYFSISGNHEVEKLEAITIKLHDFIEANGEDPQIRDVLLIIKMFESERKQNDFAVSSEIVQPIYDRLAECLDYDPEKGYYPEEIAWDFYDIRILAAVVICGKNIKEVRRFAGIALECLDELHSHEERYTMIKLAINLNLMSRYIRGRYVDFWDDNNNSPKDFLPNYSKDYFSENYIFATDLSGGFSNNYYAIMQTGGKNDFPLHKAIAKVRSGIFSQDEDSIKEGFAALERLGQQEGIRMLQEEAAEFDDNSGLDFERRRFDAIVGENIRRERLARKMSAEKLAKLVKLPNDAIALIERGEQGTASLDLERIAKVFGLPVETFYHEGVMPDEFSTHLKLLKPEQLKIVKDMVKALTRG